MLVIIGFLAIDLSEFLMSYKISRGKEAGSDTR